MPHFHVSRGKERETRLIVHEATMFPFRGPILHYTLNAPYQYAVFKRIIKEAVIKTASKHGDIKDVFPDSA
ncbi:hypothetical protein C5S39_15270 [Candidatus Methanophagaceae archaeon]|nr:hypothetical protein C5S39_15270 [Methanophagales archaeon]